jgi:hypothetical protein
VAQSEFPNLNAMNDVCGEIDEHRLRETFYMLIMRLDNSQYVGPIPPPLA